MKTLCFALIATTVALAAMAEASTAGDFTYNIAEELPWPFGELHLVPVDTNVWMNVNHKQRDILVLRASSDGNGKKSLVFDLQGTPDAVVANFLSFFDMSWHQGGSAATRWTVMQPARATENRHVISYQASQCVHTKNPVFLEYMLAHLHFRTAEEQAAFQSTFGMEVDV